ncbi:hydroxyisourate hydrolase [Pseudomonas massiliensis]|uniref:hydroxyisourate hydrolase n=1 Tax=Pseudomonas massiliensis TaxID=522492 RepID=UPI00059178FD|nr:hydroxyisourate hydrolase [Pseudomonas massiliensis]
MTLTKLFCALGLASLACLAQAAPNPLSVHVLNLQTGTPSQGVQVTLERHAGTTWQPLAEGTTNEQGRIAELFPANKAIEPGEYRVVFKTGAYYRNLRQDSFFPEIPVIFQVRQTDQHYHIPLLLSPFGFSTYRGS